MSKASADLEDTTWGLRRLEGMLHVADIAPRMLRLGRVLAILDGGNHHPLLCEMEDDEGPVGSWVVKPQRLLSASDARGAYMVLAELAAAEVCAWAGVPTPAIALARFPERVDEPSIRRSLAAIRDEKQRNEIVELYKVNKGKLAFCGRHLEHAVDVVPGTFRRSAGKRTLLRTGPAVLFLDGYIRNDDRTDENPNLLWKFDELVAIDHGHTFAGLAVALGPHRPRRKRRVTERAVFDRIVHEARPLAESYPERVELEHEVSHRQAYRSPLSWKNGKWHHVVPFSFDHLEIDEMEQEARRIVGLAELALPSADVPVILAVWPEDTELVSRAKKETRFVREALQDRGCSVISARRDGSELSVKRLLARVSKDVRADD